MQTSHLEEKFIQLWNGATGSSFPLVREFKFAGNRKWRFDFASPEHKVAFEIEGATFSQGRHTRGKGFQEDCEKYNEAAGEGWTVFRLPEHLINQRYIRGLIRSIYGI